MNQNKNILFPNVLSHLAPAPPIVNELLFITFVNLCTQIHNSMVYRSEAYYSDVPTCITAILTFASCC